MSRSAASGQFSDLYRENIFMNPSTYTTTVSDDFYQNAVIPTSPTQTTRALCSAYNAQKTLTDWWAWNKQTLNQT